MGLISKWMPHWADHRIFIKTEQEPIYDCVSTCGPRGKGLTEQMQAELGTRFNNERYFFGLEHAERLRMGKIVFQHSQFGEMTRRIFEGMACGRMVLADRMSDVVHMDELFTEGEDIIYYSNAQEAIDAVNYYATHDEEREAIALNGYSKVMANHTVSHRVDVIEDLVTEIRQETLQC
jgi:glycosyltransferase involved in cell wall biosynthesis